MNGGTFPSVKKQHHKLAFYQRQNHVTFHGLFASSVPRLGPLFCNFGDGGVKVRENDIIVTQL